MANNDVISRMLAQKEITEGIELKANPHQLWKRIQALPSVTSKPTESATEVLNEIRNTILNRWHKNITPNRKDMDDYKNGKEDAYMECIEIIDKHLHTETKAK